MSIKSKLQYLKQTKTKLKEAIEEKGQTILDQDTFRSYANKILAITDDLEIELGEQGDLLAEQKYKIQDITDKLNEKMVIAGGLDTSDATATANDIVEGKTAYVDGEKLIGSYKGSKVVVPSGVHLSVSNSDANNMDWLNNIDTRNMTGAGSMFMYCTSLITIPIIDTSNVTIMNQMFQQCINLTSIPLLNTSKVTSMPQMFYNCFKLTTIPVLDTSNVTSMQSMFKDCYSLSNESLNNILQMCINATKISSSNKKLSYIGLSSIQAETCQTLSNWDAFIEAGWSA